MFWHIAKREIYDNMTSLRFGFTVLLLVSLMTINAVDFIARGYRDRIEEYGDKTARALDELRQECSSIYNLTLHGPGSLYKKPSPLVFCADGGEDNIPDEVYCTSPWTMNIGNGYSARALGRLYYHGPNLSLTNIMPRYLQTDWAFIIGVLVSFACILFTFDSLSGEKERGTLRLMLSGSVPRSDIILGKFAGAFASIILPLFLAIILNLLVINLSGTVELDWSHWGRIGIVLLASVIYIAIFICLGMFVSAISSRSSTSLLVLLLIWTVFVVLMPNILGSICSDLRKVPSPDEVSRRREKAKDDLWEKYASKNLFGSSSPAPTRENPDMELLRLWAEYLTEERQAEERIMDKHLDAQLAQIHLARQITRISPTAIYRYALESMSSTGFERHRDFIANVRMYRNIFWEYIKSEDQKDPDSPHVYFVREGLSDKPASFDAAPRFTEDLSLADSLQDALLDIAILTFFAVLFFMATYISFLRRDVK